MDVEIPDALKTVLDKDYFAINQDRKVSISTVPHIHRFYTIRG